MKRSIFAFVPVAVVLAVSLGGGSNSVTPAARAVTGQPGPRAGDQQARAVLPTPSDMRVFEKFGRVWDEAIAPVKITNCPALDFSSLPVRGSGVREFVYDHGNGTDYDEVSAAAVLVDSAATAATIQNRINLPSTRRCLRALVKAAFKRSAYSYAPLGWSDVTSRRFRFPNLADKSTAVRVTLTGTGKGGLSMMWGLDLITVRQGRALAYMVSLNGLNDDAERGVLSRVAKRMKAAS